MACRDYTVFQKSDAKIQITITCLLYTSDAADE